MKRVQRRCFRYNGRVNNPKNTLSHRTKSFSTTFYYYTPSSTCYYATRTPNTTRNSININDNQNIVSNDNNNNNPMKEAATKVVNNEPKFPSMAFFKNKIYLIKKGAIDYSMERNLVKEIKNAKGKNFDNYTYAEKQLVTRVRKNTISFVPFAIFAIVLPEAIPALMFALPGFVPAPFMPVFGGKQSIETKRSENQAGGLEELYRWIERINAQEALTKSTLSDRLQSLKSLIESEYKAEAPVEQDKMLSSAVERITGSNYKWLPSYFSRLKLDRKWQQIQKEDMWISQDKWENLKRDLENYDNDLLEDAVALRGISKEVGPGGKVRELTKPEKMEALKMWRKITQELLKSSTTLNPLIYPVLCYRSLIPQLIAAEAATLQKNKVYHAKRQK